MKKISERLSSLNFSLFILGGLGLWFTFGILLAVSEKSDKGFGLMNRYLIPDWIQMDQGGLLLLKIWFLGLCILMGLLGINLFYCTWERILRVIRVRFSLPKFIMLLVHIIFGLVAVAHFGSLVFGFRHEGIKLKENQSFSISEGYSLKVVGIQFVDDPKVLKKKWRNLKSDEFHYRRNYAEILLSLNGRELKRGKVRWLGPLSYRGVQVTLKRFVSSAQVGIKKGEVPKPDVMLVITGNPFKPAFFVLYPLMIIGIGIYLILTWGKRSRRTGPVKNQQVF
jgi:hypothetical protein